MFISLSPPVAEEERPKISELATVPIPPAQWYTLGLALGLEEEVLNSTEVDQSHKHPKYKQAMFRKWLESTPNVSWNDLIKALVQIGEEETAEKVRKEFSPSEPSESADVQSDNHPNNSDEVDYGVCDLVGGVKALRSKL